jgi:ribosome-binding factor A
MVSRRTERLSQLIRDEVSDLLQRGINDPRLARIISVTGVEISPDLREAKIMVSVIGSEEEKADTLRGFKAASGFFRRELAHRIGIRQFPDIFFDLDDSIERGERVLGLIETVVEKPAAPSPGE